MIELRELTEDHHEIAERFWQFFLHDLSGFRDSHPDEHGSFKRRHLEPVHERLQAVPDKPHIPDDVILSFEARAA